MKDQAKMIESLLEDATEYGKTSLEIVKLKALDKSSDVISSFVPHAVILILITSFMLFLNLGLAFWLGELLGQIYIGFFCCCCILFYYRIYILFIYAQMA